MSQIGDDLLQNIFAKLPAKTFATAACVSRSWNAICNRILSHPKLISALSLNHFLPEAVKEVVGKVLCEPIRPHFAILCISPSFSLKKAHRLVTEKLSSSIPIVTCEAAGIIGREALSDEIIEMKFPYHKRGDNFCSGITLTVGYLPGFKVDAIPLLHTMQGPRIDEFIINIRNYSAFASGCMSPEAILMFGDSQADMKPVLHKMDYGLCKCTIIAGNESCRFTYSSTDNSRITLSHPTGLGMSYDAVALVFAREKTKSDGFGSIEFHLSVAAGVSAVGPKYKVAFAESWSHEFMTWLTAKREGENVTLNGQQMLDDVEMEMKDSISGSDMYIGITKRRKYFSGSEEVQSVTSVAYHPVLDGDVYLSVRGLDIKVGDSFSFYIPDPSLAMFSYAAVAEKFEGLRHKEIIGGFVFACRQRSEAFFEKLNLDSCTPILDTFPFVPLTGMICGWEIGRGPLISGHSDEGHEQGSCCCCCLHVYSSVYLVMSYDPPRRL